MKMSPTQVTSQRTWTDGQEDRERTFIAFQPPAMSNISRPTSPASAVVRPFRFTSHSDVLRPGPKSPDLINGGRIRRSSTQSKGGKGKELADSVDSSSVTYDADPFASHYNASSPFTSYDTPSSSRPSTSDPSAPLKKYRGSLLVAATDALNFTFGRKRKPLRPPPPMPLILPEVIEITAPRRDEEVEERERLRDAAAQSIGLGPVLLQETHSVDESIEEEDYEEVPKVPEDYHEDTKPVERAPMNGKIASGSSNSIALPSQNGRHRAGSLAQSHTRTRSVSSTINIPPFPTSLSALTELIQMSSNLPKYYAPTSLRIFALSKQWKPRHMVLSFPGVHSYRDSTPSVSYLHLFKSANAEDKELERLEINEDSVVFVSEEEVGGRKNVVKVGGIDAGSFKKDSNPEEGGRTLWLLQIKDADEAQKWITTIKNTILGQRSLRAGLGMPANIGCIEPRGDMDVVLSMHTQSLVLSSPVSGKFSFADSKQPRSPLSPQLNLPDANGTSSSSRSVHSQTNSKSSGTAVSALKGLFTGSTRPRSPSRATSIEQERESHEDSFGNMGSNLLSMLKSNNGVESFVSTPPTTPVTSPKLPMPPSPIPRHSIPRVGSPEQRLDRKILENGHPISWSLPVDVVNADSRPSRTLSDAALSLHPPPRKRPWTSSRPSTSEADSGIYKYTHGNDSIAGSFGVGSTLDGHTIRPSSSPTVTAHSGSPDTRPRAPSVHSVSTFASGENAGLERSSSSTKRWSRQSALLPKRLTPPSGPPPSIPFQQTLMPSTSTQRTHPYAAENARSQSSGPSRASPKSVVSSLPSFSKRASGSSAFSVNSDTQSRSHAPVSNSRPGSSHRSSMPPPPRPAPNFAPPPVPSQETSNKRFDLTPSPPKASFRDRAFRLSLTAPKPPPSSVLPPRPDEPAFKSHRKSSSSGANVPSTQLYPIPASPTSAVASLPPNGGLSSTPLSPIPVSKHTSIKQRLRYLSAPSQSGSASLQVDMRSSSPYPSTLNAYSPPATPIGEPITTLQNDPAFLEMYSSTESSAPKLPPRSPHRPPPESHSGAPEITSLSPPPRRGSKQLTLSDKEKALMDDARTRYGSESREESKLLSLSRRGSVVSLGFVSL